MSDHGSTSTYDIPLDGDLDDFRIYIDLVLPSLELDVQIAAIERYLKRTGSTTVSFVRVGGGWVGMECLLMCPDNLVQTPSVQWRIADDLATTRKRIDALRNHFNAYDMQNQSIKYVSPGWGIYSWFWYWYVSA